MEKQLIGLITRTNELEKRLGKIKTGEVVSSVAGDVAAQIHAAANKATPVDADEWGIWDSVGLVLKNVTWANIKAALKTYFDGLYVLTTGNLTANSPLSASATRQVIGGAAALSIQDAAADGSTKGAASFTATDFNATAGNISLDYANAQKATAAQPGFLTAADWSTFNGKQAALGYTPEDAADKGAASGYASLDVSALVVENPANATSTPTASKIPIADVSGKLDGWTSLATLDAAKVSKLRESDDGADALAADDLGFLTNAKSIITYWPDFPLVSLVEGDHFLQFSASYPPAWTEVDAATVINTNALPSFLYIANDSADTTWKYRKQTGITIESEAAQWPSFYFGPIMYRDTAYTVTNPEYTFGIYRDNAGAIDEQTYIRLRLQYDVATGIWQIRGEEKDGSTAHNGTYYTFNAAATVFPIQPFWCRVAIQNAATKLTRAFVGLNPIPQTFRRIQAQAPTSAPTWGQVWMQIELTQKPALQDYLYLGAVDYIGYLA